MIIYHVIRASGFMFNLKRIELDKPRMAVPYWIFGCTIN